MEAVHWILLRRPDQRAGISPFPPHLFWAESCKYRPVSDMTMVVYSVMPVWLDRESPINDQWKAYNAREADR